MVRTIKTKPIYDEAIFCDAVMAAVKNAGVQSTLRQQGHQQPDDIAMDFVVFMLRSGRWRDYRLDRGKPIQFVVDWLIRFGRWRLSNRHEARARKARGFGDDEVVRCRKPRRDGIDDKDRADKAIRFARALCSQTDAEAFEAFLRTGSIDAVAAVVQLPRTKAWAAVHRARDKVCPYIPKD